MAAGMDDFMAKPFRLDALEQKLARLTASQPQPG
jgi:CheY-like chemotaxis protein